jgi:cell division septation protein DedD
MKKESNDPLVKKIIKLRDSFTSAQDKEAANMACIGMYRCSKTVDKPCLDRIIDNLEKISKGEKPAATKSAATKPAATKSAKPAKKVTKPAAKKTKKGGRSRSRSR